MAEYLCFGDYICLYCEDTKGYMYSEQSSSTMDGLFVYTGQDRDQPAGIPNVHAITFQVFSVNRYKLSKIYRALVEKHGVNPEDDDIKKLLVTAKKAADVEEADNTAEQSRLLGKRVRYGQMVQLLHVFTNKFIHINTDNTSTVDKSKMMVSLKPFSSKNAQFKIQPRFKIKVEGEYIETYDQIVLESVKSPGNFFHASEPYQVDSFTLGSELNAGVDMASFTLFAHYRQTRDREGLLKGGDVIRLFHKDIQAYLVAEGSFRLPPVEDVHLRIREANPTDPRTLYQPKSGITYWQVELASSISNGERLCWEVSVRFRHMTTRRYLALSNNHEIHLTEDGLSPTTIFKIHSLSQRPESNTIKIDSNVRIQHVVTGCWLHAPVDLRYEKNQQDVGEGKQMQGLKWDRAHLLQIAASPSKQYQDAFTIQRVQEKEWRNFNYIAGIVPFIEDLIVKRQNPDYLLTPRQTVSIVTTLKDLRNFIEEPGIRTKDRQKLLRNLSTVDVMVRLLKTTLSTKSKDISLLYEVFSQFYQVLHTYTKGRSKKNALYAAKYIPFFMEQLPLKGEVGLECCKMMIDLIRDNRSIVDRITPDQIKFVISLLKARQHYRYLDLLGVLCVCDNIAMTENQTLITEHLLEKHKENLYHIELGQDVGLTKDIIYVSMDSRRSWTKLHTMSYKSNSDYEELKFLFLTRQLDLYKFLCFGRNQKAINVITRTREYFTWEVAYLGVTTELLPYTMRAKICDLLIGLFIEVGDNHSIISVTSNNFVYDEVDITNYGQLAADAVPHDFDSHFPSMRVWLNRFFQENSLVISSQPGRNVLLKEVLRLVTSLISYGYMGTKEEMRQIMKPMFNLLDGTKDIPFEPGKRKEFTSDQLAVIKEWRKEDRFLKGPQTDAVIQVKLQALEMIDILLIKEFNCRVRYFVSVFKKIELEENKPKKKRKLLGKLLYDQYNDAKLWTDSSIRQKMNTFLKDMYEMTELLAPNLPTILFDLTKYPSDALNTKALSILNKFYTSKRKLFCTTQRSHALLATESVRVHRGALQNMVVLTHFLKSKLSAEMADEVARILHSFSELCYVPHKPYDPHPVGQNILVNNGLLQLLIPLVTQEVDKNLTDRLAVSRKVIGAGLEVLRFLAQSNLYVQSYLMDKLEDLLLVQCCGELLALALLEIFRDHTAHCLRLLPQHIQKIVRLAGHYKEEAPSFLSLLKTIIKMENSSTLLKRNQHYVTKYIMESYTSAAYIMSMSRSRRLQILIGKEGEDHRTYFINLMELLSTCAQGDNRYVESFCQTVVTVPELLNILNNRHVPMKSKVAFARYFIWAYLCTARNAIESGVDQLHHDPEMWKHLKIMLTLMGRVNSLRAKAKEELGRRMKAKRVAAKKSIFAELLSAGATIATTDVVITAIDGSVDFEGIVYYMVRVGFRLLQTFFGRYYKEDIENYPEEIETVRKLASATIKFTDFCGEFTSLIDELCIMIECVETFAQCLKISRTTLEKICQQTDFKATVSKIKDKVADDVQIYNGEEMVLNQKMHNFGKRFVTYLENPNTLNAQLRIRGRRATDPYVPEEIEVKIPLGEEFQVHVRNFAPTGPGGSQRVRSIIQHLEIAALNVNNPNFVPDEDLDIRSLQILRTLIYNKYVALPDNWADHTNKHKRVLDEIRAIQDTYLDNDIVRRILPLLNRKVPVAMEVLSLVDLMLFNSNTKMQEALRKYFISTAEESFFIVVRQRLQVAKTALKERRSIKAQANARKSDLAKRRMAYSQTEDEDKQVKEVKMNKKALKKRSLKPFFQRMNTNRLLVFDEKGDDNGEEIKLDLLDHTENENEQEADTRVGNYQDGSDVVLVFRIFGRLCDGQYSPLQDYLRDQPDNLRKVNLVAEMTVFFGGMYTHIDVETIDLATQVIDALMEICTGNQENRAVILNNKIIDYCNFLLRISSFERCSLEQVVGLKMALVGLLIVLIEENGPAAIQIAKEIRDTLDLAAVRRHIHLAYNIVHLKVCDVEKLILGTSSDMSEQKPNKKVLSKQMKECINTLGFNFYFILARLFDVDPRLEKQGFDIPLEKTAINHYKSQCRSVEVIKDGYLQRVHFRVKNPDLLREEVIEEVKWNIDRTSPSNKLRDLLRWSKDILIDVQYQNRILKNPLMKQIAKRWAIWNYAAILLSVVINVVMLATWEARGNIDEVPDNATTLPPEFLSVQPVIKWQYTTEILVVLGTCHNICSVMLFATYLLLKHPRMPDFSFFKKCLKGLKKKDEEEELESHTGTVSPSEPAEDDTSSSRLQPSLISPTTFYYLLLLAMSFAGSLSYIHFFAFHLINIVANNTLLKGVVKAVTQNGKSLLWVGIMGVIIIYLYALVAFAFLRASFSEGDELYCRTLAQCFITVLRYGVIGDITDNLRIHDLDKNFTTFSFMTIYQLSFFILFTTIGLNIIFGIIVDTFSELRDLKWTAEKDMRDTCFICGRDSYDFEHEGKGFAHHVLKEHNMWAYVFYLLHLKETNVNDCGAIDLDVLKKVQHDVLDFFPMNRALCLSAPEEDETDTKLDDVVATLCTIKEHQRQQEDIRRREAERRRQMVWQDQVQQATEAQLGKSVTTDSMDLNKESYLDESTA